VRRTFRHLLANRAGWSRSWHQDTGRRSGAGPGTVGRAGPRRATPGAGLAGAVDGAADAAGDTAVDAAGAATGTADDAADAAKDSSGGILDKVKDLFGQ